MEQAIIQTKNLTKKYGSKTAVNSLNLQIRQGEIFGLLGPNGAGKTTTILMLLGLTEPTSGNAAILGLNCTREAVKIKRAVGYLPDNVGFYPDMTGRQNLLFTGKLNGLCSNEAETRAEALLARVGMTDAADQRTRTYSKGMKQRLGIADVLMKDPQIIIMDEPTLGIDPEGMRELLQLMLQQLPGGWQNSSDFFSPALSDSADLRPGRHLCRRPPGGLRKNPGAGKTDSEKRPFSAGACHLSLQ